MHMSAVHPALGANRAQRDCLSHALLVPGPTWKHTWLTRTDDSMPWGIRSAQEVTGRLPPTALVPAGLDNGWNSSDRRSDGEPSARSGDKGTKVGEGFGGRGQARRKLNCLLDVRGSAWSDGRMSVLTGWYASALAARSRADGVAGSGEGGCDGSSDPSSSGSAAAPAVGTADCPAA